MKRIAVIFGTRPEAIKLAPVILALQHTRDIECRVCVTGQHREMLDQVLEVFGIKPHYDLNLMKPNQTLAGLTAGALTGLDDYLTADKPDLIIVQGDTTTVFCAALAAFYYHVPVGHVEAGLRTWDLASPWPEEANRVLTSRLTTLHFAPTESARCNLVNEGVEESRVHVTGNTVIDALFMARDIVRRQPPDISGLIDPTLGRWDGHPLVLITGHRRESFGKGFEDICHAIAHLAREFPNCQFVYPVHLNPNVRRPVDRILRLENAANIHIIDPLPYLSFVRLMDRATLILSDSGGVQEEAPSLGKPVLVMRDNTERPEGVEVGTVRLVGTSTSSIVSHVTALLTDHAAYASMATGVNPYGDGRAAERIVAACDNFLAEREATTVQQDSL